MVTNKPKKPLGSAPKSLTGKKGAYEAVSSSVMKQLKKKGSKSLKGMGIKKLPGTK